MVNSWRICSKEKVRLGEPIEVYYYEKLTLLSQCDISGKRAVDCIIHGIPDKTMKSSALALRCSHPDQLLNFLMSNKEVQSFDRTFGRNRTDSNFGSNFKGNTSRPNLSQGPNLCFNCKESGHRFLQCSKPLLKCNKCNKIGHKVENCNIEIVGNKGGPSKTMCISNGDANSKFIKQVKVNNVQVDAFIDFGSEVTLVRRSLVTSLGMNYDQVTSTMQGFGNHSVQSIGTITLDLTVDEVDARVICRIVDDNLLDKPMLIGQSYTEQPHIVVYKDSNTLQFHKITTDLPSPDDVTLRLSEVRVAAGVVLYGPASVRARIDTEFSGCLMLNNNIVGSPNKEFLMSGGVYQVQNGCLDIPIFPCVYPCRILKDSVISRGEKVEFVRRIVIQSPGVSDSAGVQVKSGQNIDSTEVRLGDSGSIEDKQRLMAILQNYRHCFASSLNELGCTNVTQMTIELNNPRPIVYRPY